MPTCVSAAAVGLGSAEHGPPPAAVKPPVPVPNPVPNPAPQHGRGPAPTSTHPTPNPLQRSLDVEYVFVVFGGVIGYSGDDINKFLWMVGGGRLRGPWHHQPPGPSWGRLAGQALPVCGRPVLPFGARPSRAPGGTPKAATPKPRGTPNRPHLPTRPAPPPPRQVRIGGGVYPEIKEQDYLSKDVRGGGWCITHWGGQRLGDGRVRRGCLVHQPMGAGRRLAAGQWRDELAVRGIQHCCQLARKQTRLNPWLNKPGQPRQPGWRVEGPHLPPSHPPTTPPPSHPPSHPPIKQGEYRVDAQGSPTMLKSAIYKFSYYE